MNHLHFSEIFNRSGLSSDDYEIVTFGGAFDLAFLINLLSNKNLPTKRSDFLKSVYTSFPKINGVKYCLDRVNIRGDLQSISHKFGLYRLGPKHQAVSNAHLTGVLLNELKNVRTTFESTI